MAKMLVSPEEQRSQEVAAHESRCVDQGVTDGRQLGVEDMLLELLTTHHTARVRGSRWHGLVRVLAERLESDAERSRRNEAGLGKDVANKSRDPESSQRERGERGSR
jgi:hypothetical protein